MTTQTSYRARVGLSMFIVFAICGIMIFAAFAADDPSVITRNYRAAPPPHQHYYPTNGVKPQIGRAEDLLAPSNTPEPAKTYRRNF
jgi:hypothetical protein